MSTKTFVREQPTEEQAPIGDPAATVAAAGAAAHEQGPTRDWIEPAMWSAWARYEDLGLIGRGGMGEVRRVRDRVLGRELAMKLLPPSVTYDADTRARFLAEARVTACLEHPGIVPVHDCGELSDGQLWFTMKEVRGRTLGTMIRALHADEQAGPAPEALRRAIDVFARVCEAVAFAHGKGVLHRDLKPENVMIGEFGEVLVVDWGIARAAAAAPRGGALGGGPPTQRGSVLGTLAYMPPEQALGQTELLGPHSDVYALGAILYELLCGSAPYQGNAVVVWPDVIRGSPAPLAARCRGVVPGDLVALCERAMARAPAARPRDAGALAEEIHRFLDGARRRERARALADEARALAPEIERLRAQAASLRAEARAALAGIQPFEPAEEKARGWAIQDEARVLERAAALAEVDWHQRLHAALHEAPELDEAHEMLAEAHLGELRAAEEARDAERAARAEALAMAHARGPQAALLRHSGAVTLVTEPEGAEVLLFRYVERQRRLRPEPEGLLGRTPIREAPLPRGSYLLVLRAPGHADARYPVRIDRGAHWEGVRPGGADPFPIPLLREHSLDEDDLYVPAGWFLSGGDAQASDGLPRRHVWVDGFVLRRHPVTQAEYLAFLNDLVERGREAEAEALCPRAARAIAGRVDVPLFVRGDAGRFQPGPHAPEGQARHPVASVDWYGAAAYAAWYAARTGAPWRLAGEIEREKAARGADGRFFPWGDEPEPTWACMVGSRRGPASPAPVDDYPTDESPYGVRGLSGNVRDWCAERWTPEGPAVNGGILAVVPAARDDADLRAIRGGAWSSSPPAMCRAAGRFAARPEEHFGAVGFRLARPIPGAAG